MFNLKTKAEVQASQRELIEKYRFYLYRKGYSETISGILTANEAEVIQMKYNLPATISDLDLGFLEGNLFSTIIIETHYDTYNGDDERVSWLKLLASIHMDKIQCFVSKCAIRNPNINRNEAHRNSEDTLYSKLKNPEIIKREFGDEINSWNFTLSEFGLLCGFVSGVHWVTSEAWKFCHEDYDDPPVNWLHFTNYLTSKTENFKRRGIQEMSVVFQMMTGM